MEKNRNPEFKPKITPEQVKEQIANDKKVPNSEKAAKKTQPATKEKTEKPKKAEKKKDEALTFPTSARINDYGFIGLKKGLLEALNWHKGMALKIDKNADGSATIRKA